MNSQYIYIFNLPEDVWPFINSISDKKEYLNEIDWCANTAERDLITIADEFNPIIICPKDIDKNYIEYIKNLFEVKNITVLVPAINTGEICNDILNDNVILSKLLTFVNIKIASYSASPQFSNLVKKLKILGLNVTTPELPKESSLWTVNYYGSKSGIRKEIPKLMADGITCHSVKKALQICLKMKDQNKLGIVIKTDKGHGGEGVKIFKKSEISEKKLKVMFAADNYWHKFPIIIEELLEVDSAPDAEFIIDSNGKVKFLYYCTMRVDEHGFYKGQEMHSSVLPEEVSKKMIKIGLELGYLYSKSGYKGYFDVDFIIDKNKKLFVTESNTRHTGGTHVYRAALNLIGNDFANKTYVLSKNDYSLDGQKLNFTKVHELLKPILFNKISKEGLVIASSNLIKLGMLTYIIFARNKERALDIEQKMGVLLSYGSNSHS